MLNRSTKGLKMNNKESVHVATGVWYNISFVHKRYHHFPCHMQFNRYHIGHDKYISALEGCEPVDSTWGASYATLNGAKPRTTKELIDLTKNVCADFLACAEQFVKIYSCISLPMISMSMQRLVTGCTCYQGREDDMNIDNDDSEYNFIYNKANCLVTPSNISDVLRKKIEHIHVIDSLGGISWNQQSKLDSSTSLYVCNYDDYETGSVYVEILEPDTDVVNKNLCLISPKKTGHIPSKMAELFRQKIAPVKYRTQSRIR